MGPVSLVVLHLSCTTDIVRYVDMDSTSLRACMITMVALLLVFASANSYMRTSEPFVVLPIVPSSVTSSEPCAVPSLMHSGCSTLMSSSSRFDHRGANMLQHISAALDVVAGALFISVHYKFEMNLTSFLWIAAGNPLWSSLYEGGNEPLSPSSSDSNGKMDCTEPLSLVRDTCTNGKMDSSSSSVGDGEIESEHCAYMYLVHSLTTLIVSILRSLSPSSSDSLTTLLFQSPKRSLDPSRLIGSLLKTANGLFVRIYSNYRALYCLLATLLNTLKMWDVKSLTLRSDSVAIMTTFLRDEASVTSPIGTCNMTPGYCEIFLSNSEHCEPKKMLSCVSDKVLCGPLTTVLFNVLKYDVITTRYKWNSMPDYGLNYC